MRYLHKTSGENLECGNGISLLEKIGGHFIKNDAIQILRIHHVAAIAMAELRSQPMVADKLRDGLATRMEFAMSVAKNPKHYPYYDIQDIPSLFIIANNVGVPMTSEEIRFVYQRLHTAYQEMRAPQYYNTFHLFDPLVLDGDYSFDPPDKGLYFMGIGPMLGSCASTFRNTSSRQLLDCERLKKAFVETGI